MRRRNGFEGVRDIGTRHGLPIFDRSNAEEPREEGGGGKEGEENPPAREEAGPDFKSASRANLKRKKGQKKRNA